MTTLFGRRVLLRPLVESDFAAWQEVRRHNGDWLTRWEPARIHGAPDVVEDLDAYIARCTARTRERQLGTAFGFGLFVDGEFAGEINISAVQRGPFQNCYVGYWVDQRHAGKGYVPEGLVLLLAYAFEELGLHRVQIAIIPRNLPSHRVVEKLGLRFEGTALRYLEIDGAWEDHDRFAITAEEWSEQADALRREWLA